MKSLLSLIFLLLIISCSKRNEGTWEVSDLTKDTVFTAKISGNSYGIEMNVSGSVDDSVQVLYKKLSGEINDTFNAEVYGSEIKIPYRTLGASKGNLKIKYKILQIK